MTDFETNNPALSRLHLKVIAVGGICAVIAAIGAFIDPVKFLDAYLFAYLFILAFALGSLALVMLHHMTGGDWGYCIRRICEASAMTMPLLTILFIPIAIGAKHLFPWANEEIIKAETASGHHILAFQSSTWMTYSFWLIRAGIYFLIWNVFALIMWVGAGRHDRTGDPWLVVRLQRFSALGTLLYVITMTFAGMDWVMTREAGWFSTIIGLVLCVCQVLSAIVLALAVLRWARFTNPLGQYLTAPRLNDLGNLFMAFVILWAYTTFAQLLIIWMGNTAIDSAWYIRRGFSGDPNAPHGWKGVALLLLIAHFFIPFFFLLSRDNKRNIGKLSMLAIMMLLMRAIDWYWWAAPSSMLDYQPGHLENYLTPRRVYWLDFITPLALFGIWMAAMLFLMKQRPLLARVEHGPDLEHGVTHDSHAAA